MAYEVDLNHVYPCDLVNSSEEPINSSQPSQEPEEEVRLPEQPDSSLVEYYELQQNILRVTLAMTGVIFLSVWLFYSLNIALSYLIGACSGVVYLRMLAKSVEKLGRERKRLGSTRLAVFIGLIVIASQWQQLQILPAFLGFLTYKAALMIYVLWTTLSEDLS